jgi:hypothetical protein
MAENAEDIIQLHFMDSRLNPAGMTTLNRMDSCWKHAGMTSKDTRDTQI